MKFKISKAEYDKLSDEQKAQYKAKGEDYVVALEGMPDFDAMEANMQKLLDERKRDGEARKAAEAKAKEDAENAARARGDIEALDKSWGEKLAQMEAGYKAKLEKYHGQVENLTVKSEAQALAAKLFGKNAAPLLHNISSRLKLEEAEDGTFKTRVLGADGKPTGHTLADLEKEIAGKEEFKALLVTTKATGPTGALNNSEQRATERKPGGESREERAARALEIAQSVESGNQY